LVTAFCAHARADHELASELARFLELGCNVTCYVDEGLIADGQDLISKAAEGLCADVLLLLLSPVSSPLRWPRERWEPVFFDQAKEGNVEVVTVLLEECLFPPLLRRRNFVDATRLGLSARRLVKRWFWRREREQPGPPSLECSPELESLYSAAADQPGVVHASGADTVRFVREAADEFAAVVWAPCHGRTLAQAAGELGHQLGLILDGPVTETCRRIREVLSQQRCLVVLDAAPEGIAAELTAGGRTSTVITPDAVRNLKTPETPAYARSLISARRFAEAYELLYRLLDAVVDPENCARELTWICEDWGRVAEANALRLNYGPPGMEQLTLF
jgi:hypothetical protein